MIIPAPDKPFYQMNQNERIQLEWRMHQAWNASNWEGQQRLLRSFVRMANPLPFDEQCHAGAGAHERLVDWTDIKSYSR